MKFIIVLTLSLFLVSILVIRFSKKTLTRLENLESEDEEEKPSS